MDDKFINLNNLTRYDTKIKDHIETKTSGTEATAKAYTDTKIAELNSAKLDKKPDGTNVLIDENNKINTKYILDAILGQMLFGGSVEKEDASSDILAYPTANLKSKLGITDDTIKLVNTPVGDTTKTPKEYGFKDLEGIYFIVRTNFDVTVESIITKFEVGDWLVGAGSYWDKIDNTDAVTGVKGNAESDYRIGNVDITSDNIGLGSVVNATMDDAPIENSTNYTKSGGIYSAIEAAKTAAAEDATTKANTAEANAKTYTDSEIKKEAAARDTAISNAIKTLDYAEITPAASETIKSISETDGIIAVEKQAIQIAESQVTNLETDLANKQTTLVAGDNITIATDGKTISATDTIYSDATTNVSGLMSAVDKTKLDGIYENATATSVSETGEATTEVQYITINGTEYKLAGGSGGTTDYNSLENKPIINQDLDAAGFTPVVGAYYKHNPTTIFTPTAFNTTDEYTKIYFDITKTLNESDFTDEEHVFTVLIEDEGSTEELPVFYFAEDHVISVGALFLYDFKANAWDNSCLSQGGCLDFVSIGAGPFKFIQAKTNWNGIIMSATPCMSDYTEGNLYKYIDNDKTYISLLESKDLKATGSFSLNSGLKSIGHNSVSIGNYCIASGDCSHACGNWTTALGHSSHAEGNSTTASERASHAEGNYTTASGDSSHAEGYDTTASERASHAEGERTTASGDSSHAEGYDTTASERASHAEGNYTTASGDSSHAEGNYTTASGDSSHAEGIFTTASGEDSHAEGYNTMASGRASHAEGFDTTASGNSAHAEGQGQLTTINVTEINEAGNRLTLNTAISESELKAGMVLRHTEDQIYRYYIISQIDDVYVYLETNVVDKNINNWYLVLGTASDDGAHSEGLNTTASERGSHAEGGSTIASKIFAHAEGAGTVASGTYSHAEGFLTAASLDAAHAEGMGTVASGSAAHAEGFYTNASGDFQHVFGKYNATDTNKVEIVGKGSEETPSNARTLDWSGNEWLAGKLEATNGIDYKNSYGTSFTNGLKFVKCTQAEYDALVSAGTVDSNTFYIIVG